jgi:hypothetical protein
MALAQRGEVGYNLAFGHYARGIVAEDFGVVLFGRGDLADADAAIAEALQRLRELGCAIIVAGTADFPGLVAVARNRPAEALARYEEALRLTTRLRTPEGVVRGLAGVATVAAAYDPAAAARFFAAAAAASATSGYAAALPERAVFDRATDTVRCALGLPAFTEAWTAGHVLPPMRPWRKPSSGSPAPARPVLPLPATPPTDWTL